MYSLPKFEKMSANQTVRYKISKKPKCRANAWARKKMNHHLLQILSNSLR